jgi:hypothetical protein
LVAAVHLATVDREGLGDGQSGAVGDRDVVGGIERQLGGLRYGGELLRTVVLSSVEPRAGSDARRSVKHVSTHGVFAAVRELDACPTPSVGCSDSHLHLDSSPGHAFDGIEGIGHTVYVVAVHESCQGQRRRPRALPAEALRRIGIDEREGPTGVRAQDHEGAVGAGALGPVRGTGGLHTP